MDLMVVADWREEFLDRIKVLTALNTFNIPVEPIGYTEEEFRGLVQAERPFIQQVLEEGKVLYERKNPSETGQDQECERLEEPTAPDHAL